MENICFLTLFILLISCTNIANARSVTCNPSEQEPAQLLYPITLTWTLNRLSNNAGYGLSLISKVTSPQPQVLLNPKKVPVPIVPVFPSITLLFSKDMVSEKVTLLIDNKKTEMNKYTFKDRPTENSEIVIFASLDDSNYDLGYFKYVASPEDYKDYFGVINNYFVDPKENKESFISAYSFIGSQKYMNNPGLAQRLECN